MAAAGVGRLGTEPPRQNRRDDSAAERAGPSIRRTVADAADAADTAVAEVAAASSRAAPARREGMRRPSNRGWRGLDLRCSPRPDGQVQSRARARSPRVFARRSGRARVAL
eukprot:366047-Chlamydomonas_euryale.AAC.4